MSVNVIILALKNKVLWFFFAIFIVSLYLNIKLTQTNNDKPTYTQQSYLKAKEDLLHKNGYYFCYGYHKQYDLIRSGKNTKKVYNYGIWKKDTNCPEYDLQRKILDEALLKKEAFKKLQKGEMK